MSFEQQEQALFDLLFDNNLRNEFCVNKSQALSRYDLDDHELADFEPIRTEALQLDAEMRADLILSQLCKSYPISFSIVSSLGNDMSVLKELIDTTTMSVKSINRAEVFGNRLRDSYSRLLFSADKERMIATAILEAELGMAMTSASLKSIALETEVATNDSITLESGWMQQAIKLAPYVSAAILPRSYQGLKKKLCAVEDDCLWRHLNNKPLSRSLCQKTLLNENPKLLMIRAYISRKSVCEPAVDYKTVELNEGFATILQNLDGSITVSQILAQLKQIGAQDDLLKSIQFGFQQLLENRILELS